MKVNLGKNTIGDNKKMSLSLKDYEMSTHDLSFIFRSTMAPGLLTPFMKIPAQKGDIFRIKLINRTLTHPTLGPLFGSYKLQHFVFSCPIRLYNSWLHNNRTGIGSKMKEVKLPTFTLSGTGGGDSTRGNFEMKTNPSSLPFYLGIKGARGKKETDKAAFQGTPLLMYFDIFKNYFANTQEESFYVVNGVGEDPLIIKATWKNNTENKVFYSEQDYSAENILVNGEMVLSIEDKTLTSAQKSLIFQNMILTYKLTAEGKQASRSMDTLGTWNNADETFIINKVLTGNWYPCMFSPDRTMLKRVIKLSKYKLEELETLKDRILATKGDTALEITDESDTTGVGMRLFKDIALNPTTMAGLAVKTYDSDVFQNWVNTELIEGVKGINEASSVAIVDNKLSMDALNLAQKVYDFLNRIAVSGNTYKDWLETAYTAGNYIERPETPLFEGGMTQLIEFQEVISNAGTEQEPLGTLAGRGVTTQQKGDGEIYMKISEPSYIIGIVAITPMIDYSQGNDWDMANIKNMDDFHKPAFDGIGFEDSMNEQRAYWTAEYSNGEKISDTKAGKTVAWINYMTNFNKTFGEFAAGESEDFMVMNRNYERDEEDDSLISDLSTYIDPSKYNQIFADVSLSAQNFWVQTAVQIEVRRNISAKQIPNL
jgi:hypothetical protein